ncbi:DgyrCDS7180 [Dimorphilus gyrociliatus]|uniref:START domain-containing protein 10 n=1 Tax=Dimorphilus gyrociliatus TaxID=2664684 RepID=A0A7I8VR84_9ANNE|nr:DgyrCDS7180 [Dimorphilus gyrociliatus]
MEVGEVRIAEDEDFNKVRQMCTCHDGWTKEYCKNNITVWSKDNDVSDFKVIKLKAHLDKISATMLYDTLHDSKYRKLWDRNMIEGYEICCLNPNNDISYYSISTPSPLKNRDFVLLRSWLDIGREIFIINHSVNHASVPTKKNFVRGLSFITGYYIVPDGKPEEKGCTLNYVTQSDPKGKLPTWVVNKLSKFVAPKIVKRLTKAALAYPKWKAEHEPHFKPWHNPEQMSYLPKLNLSDIGSINDTLKASGVDESNVAESDAEKVSQNGDEESD